MCRTWPVFLEEHDFYLTTVDDINKVKVSLEPFCMGRYVRSLTEEDLPQSQIIRFDQFDPGLGWEVGLYINMAFLPSEL